MIIPKTNIGWDLKKFTKLTDSQLTCQILI